MKTADTLVPLLSPLRPSPDFSLRDLLEARDKYHADLMRHPNVVATAVGRYRIRKTDSWPTSRGPGTKHGSGVRTLENSEVRPYSWPAILVFVKKWASKAELAKTANGLLPTSLYLQDERAIPVCVIEAPKELTTEIEAINIEYPLNNIGGGNPVIAEVQGRRYAATIACLVGDGHKVYALTNRHVTGDPGEVVYSRLGGKLQRIGISSGRQLTREEFTRLYPGWPGDDLYVNLDVGLIEIDNVDRWTAAIGDRGEEMGPMVDLPISHSLSLIGCHVRGFGAASGEMRGEVHALFYRYKTLGGFEYVADLLVGPRSSARPRGNNSPLPFATLPGDSGTLWMLESEEPQGQAPMPLAVQWGRNMLYSVGTARPQSYALCTLLAKVCACLGVDPIRNWNVDQADTWGAIGHFSIANKSPAALSGQFPRLVQLMQKNGAIIGYDEAAILQSDFKGLATSAFVPMADVPDYFWKMHKGQVRPMEGPNHFADMDQPGPDGKTLLDLCENADFIDPDKWNTFYNSLVDLLDGKRIPATGRGLLPFRVWQIFDHMVHFVDQGKRPEFVCAAGVLAHYIGDACQPLHISYLHDGDPLRKYEYTFTKGKHAGETEMRSLGNGVHSAYEDGMLFTHRQDILNGLKATPKSKPAEFVTNGYQAAQRTIDLMRLTFTTLKPADIVEAFIAYDGKPKDQPDYMWEKFKDATIAVMQNGAHLLAVLWESAWALKNGEHTFASVRSIGQKKAMEKCSDPGFLPSLSINRIGAVLERPNS